MCGIAGIVNRNGVASPDPAVLRAMLGALRHRGPDGAGMYLDQQVGLAHARLSIVDLSGGSQPIASEDGTAWIICNGEIFNYVELREELLARGHRFRTGSDTEVILHLYEERGERCLEALVGDFAFAIWDGRAGRMLLARDRAGVRPLFYSTALPGQVRFASEIKALLADPRMPRALDPRALDQTFTYWSPLPGRTMFEGISELPAGHLMVIERGQIAVRRYWSLAIQPDPPGTRCEEDYAAELRSLLVDSTRLRLRADVPVGAYLSGGLDSSVTTAIVREYTGTSMETFSVAFRDAAYDERHYQEVMARALGTTHRVIEVDDRAIGDVFPDVVWHAEAALLRTSPAPMFLLSRFVRAHGLKVVLTGEGSDEFLGGYNIFKEAKVRRFWARQPESRIRPLLLSRLYGYVEGLNATPPAYLQAHFGQGLTETDNPAYSHLVRWRSTARLKRFFSAGVRAALSGVDDHDELMAALAGIEATTDPFARAQHVEAAIFLPQYLLSSQGDRMGMGNAVEGRFPFLDHRLIEFANRLPISLKLRGMTEKYLLKRAMADLVPAAITERPKQPYRAPIARVFTGPDAPAYVAELLAPAAVRDSGYFNPTAVSGLVAKAHRNGQLSEHESMALSGIVSVQLLHRLFITDIASRLGDCAGDPVTVIRPGEVAAV